tara:strand:+ start:54 stop:278 length:225 start_codon:yes stop_codon:yes gene_type:complete
MMDKLKREYMPRAPTLDGITEVTVDGTSYVIQIWTGERTVIIRPDHDIDVELDNASARALAIQITYRDRLHEDE